MKTMLLSGSTGFLGSRLAKHLEKRFNVTYIVRKATEGKTLISDLLDLNIPDKHYDCIFHMAANTRFNDDCIVNIQGTINMIDYAKRNGIRRFYHISTVFVCGEHEGTFCASDLDVGQGFNNNYEKTKFEAEKLVRNSGLDYTVFRPGIIFDQHNVFEGSSFGHVLKLLKSGFFRSFPGRPESRIYLVEIEKVIRFIMDNLDKKGTFQIFDQRLLGDLLTEYSRKFGIKEPPFCGDFRGISDLKPYMDTKVELV